MEVKSTNNMFCPQCENVYDITDNVKQALLQKGGVKDTDSESEDEIITSDIKSIIHKILTGTIEKSDNIEYINENDILQHKEFNKLSSDEQATVIQKMKLYISPKEKVVYQSPTNNIDTSSAYFVCYNCKYYEKIIPTTMIYSRSINTTSEYINLNSHRYNGEEDILPRDRNYTCPNEECPTHKDYRLKEKVTKRHKSSKIIHTCRVCTKSWML